MTQKRRGSVAHSAESGAEQFSHHRPDGGFQNPWPGDGRRGGGFLRWRWQRFVERSAPERPPRAALPVVPPGIDRPRAAADTLTVTWVGHATFLIQIGRLNVLTDPVWSERVSPVSWAGPKRIAPPGIPLEMLPPIDAILISHDHYDHLDAPTVRILTGRFGERLRWITPLGYEAWLARRGARNVEELDWHASATISHGVTSLAVTALPARH
ncbi:MAG: MBL fold metallo-hydrolase, partial [Gemmatimonadetes bacterium]|nr:MBL fold metallo-hydrolase [Gemmatimonadota bacterium]